MAADPPPGAARRLELDPDRDPAAGAGAGAGADAGAPNDAPRGQRPPGGRWNASLSWELIFRITPHLPRPVLAFTHHVTTLLCFAAMRRERAAARRNLGRIAGRGGPARLRDAYALFHQFSRFMVAYATLRARGLEAMRPRIDGLEEVEAATRAALAKGRGLIVATAHLGQWDLALKLLCSTGLPVHVAMRRREAQEVRKHADGVRSEPNLRVHEVGESELVGLELALALKRGEIVALQVDRPLGRDDRDVPLFGAPLPLPTGPVHLAWASGAPVLPVFMLLEGGDRFRALVLPALDFGRPDSRATRDADLDEAMRRIASVLEAAIGGHADQWFTFTDAWPAAGSASSMA